jgi:hypothetical protein
MDVLREVIRSLRAHPGFGIVVLISLAAAGLIGLMVLLMQVFGGFLGMAHFTDPSHRTHELTYAFLFGVAVIGMLAQLRRPSKNVAGMVMAVVPWVGLLLAAVLSADAGVMLSTERMLVAALTVAAASLHPAGPDFFRSLSVARVNWVLLALVVVAAAPLLMFASASVGLQATSADDHAGMGHYGFMAAFSFTVIGVGLVASLRPAGWRLTAWVAGVLPALFGLTSVIYPDNSSSLDLVWAFVAIAWGVVFVAVAEVTKKVEGPEALGSPLGAGPARITHAAKSLTIPPGTEDPYMAERTPNGDTDEVPDRASPPGIPRWLKVSGVVVILLIVLVVGISIIAGMEHGPGQFGPMQHGPAPSSWRSVLVASS